MPTPHHMTDALLKKHTPTAILRNAQADAYLPKLRKAAAKAIKECYRLAANAVTQRGRDHWQGDALVHQQVTVYATAVLGLMIAMAASGYKLAAKETGKTKHPPKTARIFVPDPEDEFYISGGLPGIEDYAQFAAQRNATKVNRRVGKLVATGQAESQSVAAIARAIVRAGLEEEPRALLQARTLSIWAFNAGAVENYKDAGVGQIQWVATTDDLTCEFCLALDGLVGSVDEGVVSAGELDGIGGGTFTLTKDIEHPPLHPNCRCTLVPVFDAAYASDILDQADKRRQTWLDNNKGTGDEA